MATYSIPGQNLNFALPDEGVAYRTADNGQVFTRKGGQVYLIDASKYQGDTSSLPQFNLTGEVFQSLTKLGQTNNPYVNVNDMTQFQNLVPKTGEVFTQSVSATNPQGMDLTSNLSGTVQKDTSTLSPGALTTVGANPNANFDFSGPTTTAINTNFQLLPGESLAAYSARVTPLGGVAPTAAQFTAAGGNVAGTPQIAPQTSITPSGLTSPTPANIPQPTSQTDSSSYIGNIGTQASQLQAQMAQANQEVSATEAKKNATYDAYINALNEFSTKGATQTQAELAAGIPQQQQELANINAQVMAGIAEYNQLKSDYDRMSLENRARSATMSRVIGREAAIDFARVQNLNGKAADIGLLQAQALGKSGQIEAAQKAVDKAVDLKYEDKLSRIKILEAQLASISADLTKEEKERADILQRQYDLQAQSIADAKAAEKSIQNIMLEAAKAGATAETLSAISKSTTVNEAIYNMGVGGTELTPMQKLDLQIKQASLAKTLKETSLLGEPTAADKKKEADLAASISGQNQILSDKVTLIDSLLNSSGLNQRVGSNILTRIPTTLSGTIGKAVSIVGIPTLVTGAFAEASGSGQQFAGGVHRLASTEFLNSLINAKAQGATFGALTDREGDALRAAATQINDWEIKDDKGMGTGVWNIDEASFRAELDRLKTLAQTAINRANGTSINIEESSLLDKVYSNQISPANFY